MSAFAPLEQSVVTEDPVFIDLETRSACDLRAAGGWNYAEDETTHLLTVAWSSAPDEYHVWYPWHPTIREDYQNAQQTGRRVIVHKGERTPDALRAVAHRPWCAHNAWNFDALVWSRLMPGLAPANWIDTEPLARAVGLPGGLDAIGKRLWGEGKYQVAKAQLKKYMRGERYGDAADVPAGIMPMLAEYNVQDVFLLRGVWEEVIRWLRLPQGEWAVLNVHREINHTGVPIDEDLLVSLIDLTEEGRAEAVKQIAELTKDCRVPLRTINDLQSRPTMFKWLDSIGITAFGSVESGSLRRELVQQYIDVYQAGEDEGEADEALGEDESEDTIRGQLDLAAERERTARAALAVRVLQLRSAALRITGGKLAAAASAVCADGRVRGLFVYAGAHTFRWAGRRIQVQNLPRPKPGVDSWVFLDVFERTGRLKYADVAAALPTAEPRFRHLTPDDAAAAMIRNLFVPGGREVTAGWRDDPDPLGILAADLSNIEARYLAVFAGEKWLVDAFWAGADPYVPMAEKIFGPWQNWPGVNGDPKKAKKHIYRQSGKIVELGSGYQMSGDKTTLYAAAQGVDLSEVGTSGYECNLAYRMAHPAIAGEVAGEYEGRPYFRNGIWHKLNDAALAACQFHGGEYKVGASLEVTFVFEKPHLMCYLPSGRRLVYRDARVELVQPKYLKGTDKYVEAVVYTSARYGRTQMYGGKWTENIVQAGSRDYMANGLVNVRRELSVPCLHVHDEGATIGRLSQKPLFMAAFTRLPSWSPPFPLDAEGGWLPRYSKSPPPGERYKEEVWRNGSYLKPA